jgi:hypothetical protein
VQLGPAEPPPPPQALKQAAGKADKTNSARRRVSFMAGFLCRPWWAHHSAPCVWRTATDKLFTSGHQQAILPQACTR